MVRILIAPCSAHMYLREQWERHMAKLNRRAFLASAAAAGAARAFPKLAGAGGGRRILTLVYDKSLGMMRAIDRVVR